MFNINDISFLLKKTGGILADKDKQWLTKTITLTWLLVVVVVYQQKKGRRNIGVKEI